MTSPMFLLPNRTGSIPEVDPALCFLNSAESPLLDHLRVLQRLHLLFYQLFKLSFTPSDTVLVTYMRTPKINNKNV